MLSYHSRPLPPGEMIALSLYGSRGGRRRTSRRHLPSSLDRFDRSVRFLERLIQLCDVLAEHVHHLDSHNGGLELSPGVIGPEGLLEVIESPVSGLAGALRHPRVVQELLARTTSPSDQREESWAEEVREGRGNLLPRKRGRAATYTRWFRSPRVVQYPSQPPAGIDTLYGIRF